MSWVAAIKEPINKRTAIIFIPPGMGERKATAITAMTTHEPKKMIVYDDASHTGLFRAGAFSEIRAFLEENIKVPRPKVTEIRQSVVSQTRL